ncbi:MAG: hypothetical protein ACPG32_03890 [Akkermansiaceae bacterium]
MITSRLAPLTIALLAALTPFSLADDEDGKKTPLPSVPDDLIGNADVREELGVNEFTAPSIQKIFDDLAKLAPLPADKLVHAIPKRMPLDRTDLALELGYLIAEGFIAVQAGQMQKVEVLAKDLSRYGRALGAGERVNRHAASLLENARKNNTAALKKELRATQRDVETDLVHLRDADLAHLISLGGWVRALEVGSHAVNDKFTEERARVIHREDVADYYENTIGALDPRISGRADIKAIREIIAGLRTSMTLGENKAPTKENVKDIATVSSKLVKLSLSRKN